MLYEVITEAVFYILLSLFKPLHGYGIMQFVQEISNNRVVLGPGTLYGAINTLLEKGWIQLLYSDSVSRKKEYQITTIGRFMVENEINRLDELLSNARAILGGGNSVQNI